MLTAYSSLRHFRFMLEGKEFTIFMDHKPLTHALFSVSPPWSAIQQCHLSYLAKFTSSIVHVPGPENVVPDALFQPCSIPSPSRVALVQDPGFLCFLLLRIRPPPILPRSLDLIFLSYLCCSSLTPPSPRCVLHLPAPCFQFLFEPLYCSVTLQQVL